MSPLTRVTALALFSMLAGASSVHAQAPAILAEGSLTDVLVSSEAKSRNGEARFRPHGIVVSPGADVWRHGMPTVPREHGLIDGFANGPALSSATARVTWAF